MKTYNIIEVIHMPIGSKFEATTPEKYKYTVEIIEFQGHKWLKKINPDRILDGFNDFLANTTFTKVRKKYNQLEAMVQISQGKKMTNSFLYDDLLFKNDYYFKNEKGELDCTYGDLYFNSEEYSADWYEYEYEEEQC